MGNSGAINQVAQAGLGWTRLDLDWAAVEPVDGSINWAAAAAIEQEILAVKNARLQPILVIGNSPKWALKQGFACGVIREDVFPELARFSREAVFRYSQAPYYVEKFELYNEPDAPNFLGCWGDPADINYFGGAYYGRMLQSVFPAMKSANSQVQVLVGGLLLDCDPTNPPLVAETGQEKNCIPGKFFEGILSSGAGNSFDAVAFHSYDYYAGLGDYNNPNWHTGRMVVGSNGSSTLAKAAYLRNVMRLYGITGKLLYNTEFAIFCGNAGKNECSSYQDEVEATKADYIVEFMASAMADGYKSAIWYAALGDRNNSLLNPDLTPKPVYNAYRFCNLLIGNATYVQRVADPFFVIHEFQTSNEKIWIVWTMDNQPHTLTLPSLPNEIDHLGPDGNPVQDAPSTSVTMGVAPVIVRFSK